MVLEIATSDLEASSRFALEIFFRLPSSALSNENIIDIETNKIRATTARRVRNPEHQSNTRIDLFFVGLR
jgi:hypothetical protein